MAVRSVNDLKNYLVANSLSPERFSVLCGISNMTVRRWMKRPDTELLPSKYYPIFDHALGTPNASDANLLLASFQNGFENLEKNIHDMGSELQDTAKLSVDLESKQNDAAVPAGIKGKVKYLWNSLQSKNLNPYQKTLALGSLVYFVNPIDFIPDASLGIGYLDDYWIATMVIGSLAKKMFDPKTPSLIGS